MNGQTVDVAAVAALFSTVVTVLMQLGLKTLLEQLPGIMLPKNQALHDAVLRLVVLGLNAGLLVAAAQTTPVFSGLAWYDLLALAFGQGLVSHGIYTVATQGKIDAPPAAGV